MTIGELTTERLEAAYRRVRDDLLAERAAAGHWEGELSTSALSTATAVSALAIVRRQSATTNSADHQSDLGCLIDGGIDWLVAHQNGDGGWGDTDRSLSNIATTMLVRAAFHLADAAHKTSAALRRAERYLEQQGGIPGLRRRYGTDKTFAVPILTNCALAGLVDWSEVDALPFELACLPQTWYRLAQMPVVSYAIPALVAIGQARHIHRRSRNPLLAVLRDLATEPSLRVLQRMQPASGGYLEATPLTSFVVMSLASIRRHDHPVVQAGVRFLIDSVGPDGSWPIDTNLATWVTSLSINALATGGEDCATLDCWPWLLNCQHQRRHPFTGADPGGWGWTDLSGAVPDADDTPGALLALARQRDRAPRDQLTAGIRWLLGLQNRDGGWPTFCRGWGKLPFDRSGTDLTAHALRALHAWRDDVTIELGTKIDAATQRGLTYLERTQCPDGSWLPLWFGNQHRPDDENPLYGTARVLLVYRDLGQLDTPPARSGLDYLAGQQNTDGGWGGGPELLRGNITTSAEVQSSIEESAVVIEALLSDPHYVPSPVVEQGLAWLVAAVESGRHRHASPIGFYFAKLWYYERLYPLIFVTAALGTARRAWSPQVPASATSRSTLPDTAPPCDG